jgi:hypothetical protein
MKSPAVRAVVFQAFVFRKDMLLISGKSMLLISGKTNQVVSEAC